MELFVLHRENTIFRLNLRLKILLYLANLEIISNNYQFKHGKNRLKYTVLNTNANIRGRNAFR